MRNIRYVGNNDKQTKVTINKTIFLYFVMKSVTAENSNAFFLLGLNVLYRCPRGLLEVQTLLFGF